MAGPNLLTRARAKRPLRRRRVLHTNTHAARTRTGAHEIDRRPGAQSSVTSNAATQ